MNPIDMRKYYIGVRSSNCLPDQDNYYSSSKVIKELIKEHGNTFNKKIIKTFENRIDAISYEIFIHKKQNVSTNPLFYNLTNQLNNKFDTSGFIFIDGVRVSTSEYSSYDKKYHSHGKVTVKDKNKNNFQVSVDDIRIKNRELSYVSKGQVPILTENGSYKNIDKSEYDKFVHMTSTFKKAPVVDKHGNRFLININDVRYLSGEFVSVHKNKVICKDRYNNTHYVDKKEFLEKNYIGINKGCVNGSSNPNAKLIKIYDENENVRYICNGNFKKTCIDNGLPFDGLRKSYTNGGTRIYKSVRGNHEAIKRNLYKFIGWYAKCESD